jgi:hypothetical protein
MFSTPDLQRSAGFLTSVLDHFLTSAALAKLGKEEKWF